jgi:glycine oxidase
VGLLRVALTAAEETDLRGLMAWAQAQGMEADWIAHDDLLQTEPALSEDIRGAMYTTGEHQIRAVRLTHAYARAAANRGVQYRLGSPVAGLAYQGERVTGVRLSDGSAVSADHVVIAAGAWSALLGADVGVNLPVRPVRGQLVHLQTVARVIRLTVMHGIGYVTPKVDGTVVVGATQEEVGFDTRTTAEGVASMLALGPKLVPALAQAEIAEIKVGLRPGTPDDLPILGPAPGWQGLTIATGHFRSGVVLSPITGKLIAESIITGQTDPLLAPFSPARFA